MNLQTPRVLWTGRIVSGVLVVLLLVDATMKLVEARPAVEGMAKLGYPAGATVWIGLALLVSVVLYAIPSTAVLGAILLTGYLGGAVATHVRAGDPLLGYVLSPVYVGILLWGALYCRSERLRALIPLRRGP